MGTTITFRRGENDPTSGSGLTLAEPAFNTTLKTFHIGLGYGVTAAWVGAPISGASAEIAAGITYKTPTLKAVKDYVTDYVTAVNGVLTVNGFAGGVTLNAGTAIGVTASGGNITVTNLGVQSFNGSTGAVQGVSSWNGQTGAVSFVNYVVSFNGLTGAVGGVTTSAANTFVPMQSFSGGISAAGGTFSKLAVFISGIESAGITASTVTSDGTSTIPGYPGYASTTTVSADTINFVFDGVGGQILRPTNDNIDGSTRTNYLPASSGTLALTSQLMGAVNGSLAATTAVTSFNGLTGAVTGVTVGGNNTFTALNSFNTGISSAGGTFSALTRFTAGISAAGGTFSALTRFTAGISAAGASFSSDIWTNGWIRSANTGITLSPSNPISSGTIPTLHIQNTNSGLGRVEIRGGDLYLGVKSDGGFPDEIVSGSSIIFEGDQEGDSRATTLKAEDPSANRTVVIPNASGTLALTSQLMGAVNGSTAATTAVTSFNGSTGAVQGVSSFNGLTGAVGGVCAAQANTFTALQSFNSGISSAGGTFTQETRFASGLSASIVKTLNLSGYGGLSPSFIDGQFRLSQLMGTFTTVQTSGSTDRTISFPDADGTLALTSQLMGAVNGSTAATTAVTSFNGLTGAVTGVTVGGVNIFTQVNTFSAGISAAGGTFSALTRFTAGITTSSLYVSAGATFGGNITIPASGSINSNGGAMYIGDTPSSTTRVILGDYGAVGNNTYIFLRDAISALDIVNPFGAARMGDPESINNGAYFTVDNTTGAAEISANSGGISLVGLVTINGLLHPQSGISASGGVTFGGTIAGATATFSRLTTHSGGITTSSLYVSGGVTFGATAEFSRSVVLQNSEFIRNSTNGRIDFMPAPSGTTHYGLYVDCTTWGFGPQIGTIRSSDNALDTTGILFTGQLTMGSNVRLNLGSNGQNGIVCANQGNDTIQIFTDVTSGTNSGGVAIIDTAGQNTANRSPTTVHANPNLYIYRAGSASANDFIRIEHDGTNANIVTGGSSAIDMEPGSGFVGFSGGISASGGITFSSTMRVAGTATFAGLINSTAGLSGTGITLSGNLSAATKSFVIPHPTQPHMTLQHGSLEGPENGVYVRGRLTGTDTIPIPHYWSGLVDSSTITVTLTEIGNRNHHWVAAVDGYTVTVASEGGGIDCFYTVWGERKDVGKLPVEY